MFVYTLLQELLLEKETRIRETMLMMGLQQWILWSTWYLKQLLFLLLTVLLVTILMKVRSSSYLPPLAIPLIWNFCCTNIFVVIQLWLKITPRLLHSYKIFTVCQI